MNLWDLISSVIGNMQVNTKGLGGWINGHLSNIYSLITIISFLFLFIGGYTIIQFDFFNPNKLLFLLINSLSSLFFMVFCGYINYGNLKRIRAIQTGNQMIEQMCSDPTTIKIQTSILSDTIHPKKRVELVVQKEQEGHVATLSVGDNIVRQVLLDKT